MDFHFPLKLKGQWSLSRVPRLLKHISWNTLSVLICWLQSKQIFSIPSFSYVVSLPSYLGPPEGGGHRGGHRGKQSGHMNHQISRFGKTTELNKKPLTKVAPGLLVIQIQIQAVWLDNVKSWKVILKYCVSDMENRKKTIGKNVFNNLFNLFGLPTQI